jgi:hypothetical protein
MRAPGSGQNVNRLGLVMVVVLAVALLAWPTKGWAHSGGIQIGLEYGYGDWSFDRTHLVNQVGPALADDFLTHTHSGQTAALHLGYNILGFGGPEVDVTATGWNITSADRGGGGMVAGIGAFSPFNFFLPPERRWDAQVFLGYGYGLVGQTKAMDGGVFEWGARGEFFVTPNLSLGAALRFYHPQFGDFILDYDNRSQPGNTLKLPQGSGGLFWMLGVQVGILLPVGGEPH